MFFILSNFYFFFKVSIQFDDVDEKGWDDNDLILSEFPSIYVNGQKDTSEPSLIYIPNIGVLSRTNYYTYIPTVTGNITEQPNSPSPTQSSPSPLSSNSEDDIAPIPYEKKTKKQESQSTLSYGFVAKLQASTYRLQTPNMEILIHSRFLLDKYDDSLNIPPNKIAGYLQVVVNLPSSICVDGSGLFNANQQNITGQSDIDHFVNTWLVHSSQSLFNYDDGLTTESYSHTPTNNYNFDDDDCKHWSIVSCDREALSRFNESCINDIMLLKNHFIIQNYHAMESQLHMVSNPIFGVFGQDNLGYFYDDEFESSGNGFMLTLVISVSVIIILVSIAVIYRRRKRRRMIVVDPEENETELDEMLSDNDRAELFD